MVNTVERLGDDFDFRIVTRDHDGKADRSPYQDVQIDVWNQVGKALVNYLPRKKIRLAQIRKHVEEVDPDSIYLNSFFSSFTILVLLSRKLGWTKKCPIVIAPEGELSKGALQLKPTKKKLYLRAAAAIDLYKNILWKTTSKFESEESEKLKGTGGQVFIAPNMPPRTILPNYVQDRKPAKMPGAARMVFLSRVHPKKNLRFLLELFGSISENVHLDVYGPLDDEAYAESCLTLAGTMPENVKVEFKGEIEHAKVGETLFEYDFFVLSTLGENFGHVFIEALAAGCPLIISDRTPWIDLEEKGVGWDIPLEDRERWISVIRECASLNNEAYAILSTNARDYAEKWLADKEVENATRRVLEHSVELSRDGSSDNRVRS